MDAIVNKDFLSSNTVNPDNIDPVGFLPEGSEALSKYIEEDLKNEQDSDEELNRDTREKTLLGQNTEFFLKAAEKGKKELVIEMLQKDKTLVSCQDSDGYSALHRSSYNGHVDIVKVLLENGADIAIKTEDNWQPLHCACRWDKTLVASTLLQNGADINAQTSGGHTPLHLAATHARDTALLEILLTNKQLNPSVKNCQNETALDLAKKSGRFEFLFELVEPSVDVKW